MNSERVGHRLQWPQWLAAFGASSLMFSLNGIDIVWMNDRKEEPPGLSTAIFTTLVVIGAFIGSIFADMFGRKNTLLMMLPFAIPRAVNSLFDWRGLTWMSNFFLDCFIKFSSGITCTLVPLYISEISSTDNRGSLVVMQLPVVQAGTIALHATAMLAQRSYNRYDGNVISAGLLLVAIFVHAIILGVCPETPQYLNWKKSYQEAAQSLGFYRRIYGLRIRDNATSLPANTDDNKKAQGWIGKVSEIFQSGNRRGLGIIFFLIIIKLVSGIAVTERTLVRVMSQYRDWSPDLWSGVGLHLPIISYLTTIFIFSVFVMFAIDLLDRKSSLLVAIVINLTALINEMTLMSHYYHPLFHAVHHLCYLIFIAVTLSYVGKFFSITHRATAMALTVSFEILCRSLIFYIRWLMLQTYSTNFIIEESFVKCAICVAAFFIVLIFFPKTNKVSTSEIEVETSNGIKYL